MSGVLGKAKRIHFIGIGGIGMSGIAELLVNLGYEVSGSDMQRTDITERLASLGARIEYGHAAEHLAATEVVVYSSAIRATNPELAEARAHGLTIVARADVLAELMRIRQGVAIAGAHGKTTTTSMIALAMEVAGLDPTAIIGGRVSSFGSNAKLGRGAYLVAEADESDRSFLKLAPRFAVITNIDREHLESYRDFEDLKGAFVQFANNVPANGVAILCADDRHLTELRSRINRHTVTYGLDDGADVSATDLHLRGFGSSCKVRVRKPGARAVELGLLQLSVPGRHNVLNALAAIAMCQELGVAWTDTARALNGFRGAERRFERRGEANGITVIEDYGHHPTEIAAALAAGRQVAGTGRVIVAFQPHRFTRTQMLLKDFGPALVEADAVVLTDIYAAGEDPIAGVTIDALAQAIKESYKGECLIVPSLVDVPQQLASLAKPGDLIILLGAGSIGSIAGPVIEALEAHP